MMKFLLVSSMTFFFVMFGSVSGKAFYEWYKNIRK